jgi:ribosomal protein S18 acetylase RimI-like enzyme
MTSLVRAPNVLPLSADDGLVAIAQCMVLDADVFPHASIQFGLALRGGTSRVFVVRDEARGPVLGFIAGQLTRGVLHVVGLAVEPSRRRQGFARALLRAIVGHARECDARAVALQVSTTNRGAIDLYEREGFEPHRVHHGYYASGVYPGNGDALEMVRTLAKTPGQGL